MSQPNKALETALQTLREKALETSKEAARLWRESDALDFGDDESARLGDLAFKASEDAGSLWTSVAILSGSERSFGCMHCGVPKNVLASVGCETCDDEKALPVEEPVEEKTERLTVEGTDLVIVNHGTMRGAHGQEDALVWAVLEDGSTLFHDTARSIFGVIDPSKSESHRDGPFQGRPGSDAVHWGYIRGYAYSYHPSADRLGVFGMKPTDRFTLYQVDKDANWAGAREALRQFFAAWDEDAPALALNRGMFGNCDQAQEIYDAVRPHGFAVRGDDMGRIGGALRPKLSPVEEPVEEPVEVVEVVEPVEVVEVVEEVDPLLRFKESASQLTEKSFELRLCVCGCPTFQQPCPTCNFYPYGYDKPERKRVESLVFQGGGVEALRDGWIRRVNGAGGVGPWFARIVLTKNIAYQRGLDGYRAEADAKVALASSMEWPSAEAVLEALPASEVSS